VTKYNYTSKTESNKFDVFDIKFSSNSTFFNPLLFIVYCYGGSMVYLWPC